MKTDYVLWFLQGFAVVMMCILGWLTVSLAMEALL